MHEHDETGGSLKAATAHRGPLSLGQLAQQGLTCLQRSAVAKVVEKYAVPGFRRYLCNADAHDAGTDDQQIVE